MFFRYCPIDIRLQNNVTITAKPNLVHVTKSYADHNAKVFYSTSKLFKKGNLSGILGILGINVAQQSFDVGTGDNFMFIQFFRNWN